MCTRSSCRCRPGHPDAGLRNTGTSWAAGGTNGGHSRRHQQLHTTPPSPRRSPPPVRVRLHHGAPRRTAGAGFPGTCPWAPGWDRWPLSNGQICTYRGGPRQVQQLAGTQQGGRQPLISHPRPLTGQPGQRLGKIAPNSLGSQWTYPGVHEIITAEAAPGRQLRICLRGQHAGAHQPEG